MTRADMGLIEGVFLAFLFLVIVSVEDAPRSQTFVTQEEW